jgi:hypothetical protein
MVIKLERKSPEKVIYSITLNNVTYDFEDDNPEVQPKKIDTIAFYYPNPKKYTSITLAGPWFSMPKCTSEVTNPTIKNTIVFAEKDKFCAWPANNGVWNWENEILVGFSLGRYKEKKSHNITSPSRSVLGRSLDGGEIWKLEDPDNFVGDGGEVKTRDGDINFTYPHFAMRVGGISFFISYDRGHHWKGPFDFGNLPKDERLKGLDITSRTDYMVLGKNQCMIFKSAKPGSGAFGTDRTFVTSTTDGGASFEFISWVASFDDPYRAVMPSTVRCSDTKLVSALRRRNMNNRDQKAWVDVFGSDDNGQNWSFLSQVGIAGGWNGNPPAMVKTQNGRLCCVYGNRDRKTMHARYSSDQGKTWGKEYTLRKDYQVDSFNDPDLGYPRLVVRPDGKLVAMYYWATLENPHHHIAATIWDPTEDK